MTQTVKLKRSATQGAAPSTSDLALGEVAINTYDGKMYIKKNDGSDSIVEIGSSSLPSQTGNSGYFLTTDGTNASWSEIDTQRYETATVTTNTTLDADTHYFTGSGSSINDGVLLTIPANSLLEVKYYSAGKSL